MPRPHPAAVLGAITVALLALVAAPSAGQTDAGADLRGTVTDAEGGATAGICVLAAAGGETLGAGLSDGDGVFTIGFLPRGTVEVWAVDCPTLGPLTARVPVDLAASPAPVELQVDAEGVTPPAEVPDDLVPPDPAPRVTFVDVPATHIFAGAISWLVESGITAGCGDGRFCPGHLMTRGQMAVFLDRALALPAVGGVDTFRDDDGSPFEPHIEALAAAGIASGCATDRFCPDTPITRGQNAAFLNRAFAFPDDGGGDLFTDDDGSPFEPDIDRLAAAGVTRGCAPDRFCPGAPLTRGQMASLLYNAFDRPLVAAQAGADEVRPPPVSRADATSFLALVRCEADAAGGVGVHDARGPAMAYVPDTTGTWWDEGGWVVDALYLYRWNGEAWRFTGRTTGPHATWALDAGTQASWWERRSGGWSSVGSGGFGEGWPEDAGHYRTTWARWRWTGSAWEPLFSVDAAHVGGLANPDPAWCSLPPIP